MPSESLGGVQNVSFEEEQKACRTVERNATDEEDTQMLLAVLGIVPDAEYQASLRST